MAEAINIVMLVCYCVIFLVGITLNAVTMYVLVRDKELRKKMASVRWLMFGDAFCGFMVCLVGVPLMASSVMVGDAPPFTTAPLLCHAMVLVGYGQGVTSFWYQTAISLTRLAAVMTPNWYRMYVRIKLTNAILLVFPWVFAYTGYIVAAADKAYYIRAVAGTGSCETDQYDDTPASADRYAVYVLADTITNEWTNMLIGLSCYVAIYVRKWWMNRRLGRRVQPATTSVSQTMTEQTTTAGFPMKTIRKNVETDPASAAAPPSHHAHGLSHAAAHTVKTAAAAHHSRMHDERDKKLKLLSIAYVVNICILLPINIVYGLNYYGYLVDNYPVIARILDMSWFTVFPLNPLLYVLVSGDFRQAYRQCLAKH